jgi:hypothetical protein
VTALYEIQAEFLSGPTPVVRFEGVESLNTPYIFRVDLVLEASAALAIDLDGATGKNARLVVNDRDGTPRVGTSGIVAALEHIDDPDSNWVLRGHPDRDADGRRSRLDGLRYPPRRQLSTAPSRLPV